MSKAVTRVRKKEIIKIIHPPLLRTNIKAQMASAAPPLGPMLGQRGLNVANFCKEFNKETGHIKQGVPLPTRVHIRPDRTYDLEICMPTTTWLLKQAAGVKRGAMNPAKGGEFAGIISVKHVYEIAKLKSQDKACQGLPLEVFLDERRAIVQKQLVELADKKAAKMLRTT
ncbi:hypothetical protein WR25_17745 [Diploscapter pachys]|uniref:Large ribosomal subunit protein uL11m n=1 Tax=Diploscapter pachys TaxID=2018661 RepID=A0A2A2LPH2_9BILA|nr:hypothetical protein WR25_17745 [Diploscapter pachys]